jgi:hypothetical protein
MRNISRKSLLLLIFFATIFYGCIINNESNRKRQSEVSSLPIVPANKELCPIPPLNYEKISGYQPAHIEPSLSSKKLEFISPTLEGNPTYYLGILQQPVRFCGLAKNSVVKVKLFASGAYLYEKKYPNPENPERLLGETQVEKSGVWFFSYDFRDGDGVRRIIAKGYNSDNQEIATTSEISITLAGPNPS